MTGARLPAVRPAGPAATPPAGAERRRLGVGPTMAFGIAAAALFFGGFAGWAAVAPLESAAIAPGEIGVSGERRTVQHLEGGIVAELRVAEGDAVRAGETVLVLDDTRARAALALVEGRRRSAAALRARLAAERDGLPAIRWPGWLRRAADGGGGGTGDEEEVLAAQERIFAARRASFETEAAIVEGQAAQLRQIAAGLAGQIAAQDRQLTLLAAEIRDVRALVAQGFARRPRLLALERRQAEVEGERARNRAETARIETRIGEARLELLRLGNARRTEVTAALREVEAQLAELRERLAVARDALARTRVAAPVAGTVVGLAVFTQGGVVAPGQRLMDIVPKEDSLVIEARVAPTDIDSVAAGLPARVHLTSFSLLSTPPLDGRVQRVSADSFTDERTGAAWYEARVVLDPDQPALAGLRLMPGMPAEVMIVTGANTPLEYLLKPILVSLRRALREE